MLRGPVSSPNDALRPHFGLTTLLTAPPLEPELEIRFRDVVRIVRKKSKLPKRLKSALLDLLTWTVTDGKKARDKE